jgi:phosphohistidine phosphatase
MALRLKDAGYQPEHIVSSSAVRAKTTAAFFADRFNIPLDLSDNLYHGLPEDYLEAIRSESENIDCMALFGHNPGITYLANMIQPGCTDNIPTCGIIIAASDLKSWEDLSWQNIQLQALMFPKSTGHE